IGSGRGTGRTHDGAGTSVATVSAGSDGVAEGVADLMGNHFRNRALRHEDRWRRGSTVDGEAAAKRSRPDDSADEEVLRHDQIDLRARGGRGHGGGLFGAQSAGGTGVVENLQGGVVD